MKVDFDLQDIVQGHFKAMPYLSSAWKQLIFRCGSNYDSQWSKYAYNSFAKQNSSLYLEPNETFELDFLPPIQFARNLTP